MNLEEWSKSILLNGSLESKLRTPPSFHDYQISAPFEVDQPERDLQIAFSDKRSKFPKKLTIENNKARGVALHFFANHELLAIEMMAQAVLKFEGDKEGITEFRRDLVDTIVDEQKHLRLYIERMNELEVVFGSEPLNGHFWTFMKDCTTLKEFAAVMSLTFEGANLDFALFYQKKFEEIGDHKTAKIMNTVLRDEIKHVQKGVKHTKVRERENPFNFYKKLLPSSLSPNRGKGKICNKVDRLKAGLPESFIDDLMVYKDNFDVLDRGKWKT